MLDLLQEFGQDENQGHFADLYVVLLYVIYLCVEQFIFRDNFLLTISIRHVYCISRVNLN